MLFCPMSPDTHTSYPHPEVWVEGFLPHKNPPSSQGPPYGPRHSTTVGSQEKVVSPLFTSAEPQEYSSESRKFAASGPEF